MNKKIKKIFLPILTLVIILFLFINSIIGNDKLLYLKQLINEDQKYLIKRYIFPYKLLSQQEKIISQQEKIISDLEKEILNKNLKVSKILLNNELTVKKNLSDIEIKITENNFKLSNNKILKKYSLIDGFYYGINKSSPGSGYIDFYENNLFVLSSRGILAYKKNFGKNNQPFKQIKNNINSFIGFEQYISQYKGEIRRWFSLKDIFLNKDKIFISYTEEIKQNCWNTGVIYGNINYENIKFKKIFLSEECVHEYDNIDNEFNAHQSGGRITNFDDDHILLSIGDYRSRHLSQNKKSINGKILKININNSDYEIISMGHRNPQGLYFDKQNKFILETEHGPNGGDEINLIEIDKIKNDEIPNFGWAIVSDGDHYGGRIKGKTDKKYEKYPLYKSHSEHGFIEPIKSFVPSIGISEIVKIGKNKYVVSSLKDESLYFFELNENKKMINLERVKVFERIRDLKFYDNKLYIFLEATASIGIIDLS